MVNNWKIYSLTGECWQFTSSYNMKCHNQITFCLNTCHLFSGVFGSWMTLSCKWFSLKFSTLFNDSCLGNLLIFLPHHRRPDINAFECFCDCVKWIANDSWDSPIISLDKMVIRLHAGAVAHSIFWY